VVSNRLSLLLGKHAVGKLLRQIRVSGGCCIGMMDPSTRTWGGTPGKYADPTP